MRSPIIGQDGGATAQKNVGISTEKSKGRATTVELLALGDEICALKDYCACGLLTPQEAQERIDDFLSAGLERHRRPCSGPKRCADLPGGWRMNPSTMSNADLDNVPILHDRLGSGFKRTNTNDLMAPIFPPLKAIVPGYVYGGFTVLAGRQKPRQDMAGNR